MRPFRALAGLAAAATLCCVAPGPRAWAQTSAAGPVTIRAGTEIPLVTITALSSKTAAKGDLFDLEVSQDVVRDGRVLIPKGTRAVGELTRADPSGAFGSSGALQAKLLYIVLGDETVRIYGILDNIGKNKAGTVIAAFVITPIIKGKSVVLPAGTAVTGVVDRDVLIDR